MDSTSSHFQPTEFSATGTDLYEWKNRPRRDSCVGVTYVVLLVLTGCLGIVTMVKANKDFSSYSTDFYAHSTTCNITSFNALYVPPSTQNVSSSTSITSSFTKAITIWLPITAVASIAASVLYVYLFKRYAEKMVWASIIFSVGWSAALSVICFLAGAAPMGIILIIVTVITAVVYWWIRGSLKQCADLLAVAGHSLCDIPQLIPAALGIKLAGVTLLLYLFTAFVFSLFNGAPMKASAATIIQEGQENATCYDVKGRTVDCCLWAPTGLALSFAALAWIMLTWTAFSLMELKLYMVADSVAQWYFSPPGQGASVGRAVKNGLTSSFGSIVFGGLILAIIDAIRSSLRAAQERGDSAQRWICCIINCICQPILAMLEMFTRFATIGVAITGLSFISAAKQTFGTLKRNFLRTFNLWWIPDMVLRSTTLLISLGWATLVFFLTLPAVHHDSNKWAVCFSVALVCFLAALFILHFIASMLLDITNTIYICWSIDRDQRKVTKPEIHAIYQLIPNISTQGALIENPDGGYSYGAPTTNTPVVYTSSSSVPPGSQGMYGVPPGSQGMYGVPPGSQGMYGGGGQWSAGPPPQYSGYSYPATPATAAAGVQGGLLANQAPPPYVYGAHNV